MTFVTGKGSRSLPADDVLEGVEKEVGTVLATVEATSTTSGKITYAFEGGDVISGFFSIDEDSGVITYGADTTFDFEDANPNSYTLNVVATDASNDNTAKATIIVNVQDVNDHAPLFASATSFATLAESHIAADGIFTAISATDADGTSPNNAVVRYQITGGTGMGIFTINNNGGVSLDAGQTLDYDTAPTSYTLEITATDGGGADAMTTPEASKLTLTIALTDVNDIVPSYTESGVAMVRMTGVHGHNYRIHTGYSITIDDADTNNVFTFGLSDTRRFEFRDQGNGVWGLFLIPDRVIDLAEGTIALTYQLRDGKNDAPTAGSVNVEVVETSVRFTENMGDQSVDVMEGATQMAGAQLAVVEAVALASGSVTYALAEASDLFSIDADSGIITYIADTRFDFEMQEQYTLNIVATNNGNNINSTHIGDTATATITINVGDVNEHAPTFPVDTPTTAEVAEAHTAADGVITTIAATDADGASPNHDVRYEITAGNIGDTFTIDVNGGIRVAGGKILDYDTSAIYKLEITAFDGDTPPMTSTHEITITVIESTGMAAAYSLSQNGRILAATITTPDPDGIKAGTTPTYQWFNQDTGTVLGTTNSNSYTLPSGASADGYYGVIITYTDGSDVQASVIAYNFDKSVHVTPMSKTPTATTTLTAHAENLYIGDNAANTASAPGSRNDVFYGFGGDDTLNGGGWNDVFYGGNQVDVFWGGGHSDVFVLDVDAAVANNRNVDIVGDFTHSRTDSGQHAFDRIRVYVDEPSVITTLAQLQTALGISFVPSSAKIWRRADDNVAIDDLHITNEQSVILMVIEDFYTPANRQVTLSMFEVLSTNEKPTAAVHHLEITEHKGGANPLAQNVLTIQSLKGAIANIQGTHSDLFEVQGNGLGKFQLFVKAGAELDHETHGAIALTIYFSEVKDVSGTAIETFDAQRVEITVTEGNAEYAITQNQAGVLRVDVVTGKQDPDGVVGAPSYQWFKIENGADVNVAGTGASYTPSAADAALTHGVVVTYTDSHDVANGTQTVLRVIYSPVRFADDEISVRINENDATATVASVTATSSESGGSIAYAITDGDAGGLFTIGETSGKIMLTRALDYESDDTNYTLEITATYTSGAKNTATVNVYVSDVNDFAPVLAADVQVAAGLSRAIVGTSGADDPLDGTDGVIDYIDGGAGNDMIDGGGGDDHILGGQGDDTITLAEAKGSTETIYYRFSSTDAGFRAEDGTVIVKNFRYYEDNLVLVDTDANVITLDNFLADANIGTRDADGNVIADGKLNLEVFYGDALLPVRTLGGIKIWINGIAALTINFAEDSQPKIRGEDARWTTAGVPFLGTLDNAAVGLYRGLYFPQLNDNGLLKNYFNDLRIIDDADMPSDFATDVFISESRTHADGAFVTLPATDGDGASPNNAVRYAITAGNIGDVFSIDDAGGISVAAGKALDFETTTAYTLTITATDGGAPAMKDTHTLTIAIEDANDITPMLAVIGGATEVSFAENNSAPTPQLVTALTFSIADTDANNDFTFRVMAAQIDGVAPSAAQRALAEKFEVVQVNDIWTLKLKPGKTIDFETEAGLDENNKIALSIVVNDGVNDSNEIEAVLTVTNVNDTGPTLALSTLSTYALDEQPIPADASVFAGVTLTLGSVVEGIIPDLESRHFSVQGDDGDRFEVVAGRTSAEWHIHLKAGEILEYETEPRITLRVTADDGANAAFQTGDITINVRDINNHAPILASDTPKSVEISESRTDADPAFATITASDADGTAPNNAVRYEIVSGNVGAIFKIDANGGVGVAAGKVLDFDTTAKYTLTILVSDGGTPAKTLVHNLVITLTDVNDITPTYTTSGSASIRATASGHSTATPTGYSIAITDADTDNDFTITVAGDADDRFAFIDQGNGVWALFLKANRAVTASSANIALTYQISDGVNDATPGAVTVAVVETSVGFAAGKGNQVIHIDENDATLTALPTLEATSTDTGGSIAYAITAGNADDKFAINADTGAITLKSGALNYESDATEYTLEITATHTPSDATNTAIITIYVNDLNEHAPIFAAAERAAGVSFALMGTNGVDTLSGTGAAEYISGGASDDILIGGRGDDHLWGGLGDDEITLSEMPGSAETIYYLVALTPSGLLATDGGTVVHNFRYDEDNLFFVDAHNNLDLDELLSDVHMGRQIAADGKLYLEPIIGRTDGSVISRIAGINIYISGTKALTLNFAEDSQPLLRGEERFSRDSEPFLGVLDGTFQYRGYISPGLIDNALLKNYVNELRIIDSIPDEFVADIYLAESRTAADGVFATLAATDADGTSPNHAVRYAITSGNIGDAFSIDANGGISIAAGKALDFDTISSYTLEITATDGGTPARFDTQTITIAVGDVNDTVPTYTPSAAAGATLTLTGTDFDGNAEDVSTGYSIIIDDADTSNSFTFGLNDDRFEFRDQGDGVWELFLKEFQPVFYFNERTVALTYYVDDGVNRAAAAGAVNFAVADTALRFEETPISWRVPGGIVLESTDGAAFALGDLRASGGLYGKPLIYSIISVNGVAYNAAVHSFYLDGNTLWHKGTIDDYETTPIRTDATERPFRGDTLIFGVRDETAIIESTPIQVEIANVDEGRAVYELISSTEKAGGTLTVNRISDDPDGIVAGSESYAWTRTTSDGRVVSIGTDSPTYQRVAADSGTVIGVYVSYIDASSNRIVTNESLFFYDDFGTIAFEGSHSNGDDVINGAADRNTINAKGGNDVVYGAGHGETINGGGGHDVLYGGSGDDTLNGGEGNDILNPGSGSANRLTGGAGADYYVIDSRTYFNTGGNRATIKNFGEGDRIVINLQGWGSNPYTISGDGLYHSATDIDGLPISFDHDDFGGGYTIFWTGGSGDKSTILRVEDSDAESGGDHLDLGFIVGVDMKHGSGADDILIGGDGGDNFYGYWGHDIIYGMGGDETIYGGEGNDIIHGGAGDDTLIGDAYETSVAAPHHAGNDFIYGGAGNDFILGTLGSDHIYGGTGDDYLEAGIVNVRSYIYGGDGIDFMRGDTNQYWTTYHLDTRELAENTDIIAQFSHNPGRNEYNQLRVYVTEEQRTRLELTKDEGTWLALLRHFLDIRWDDSNRAKPGTELKALIANNNIAQSREPTRHPNDFWTAATDTNTRDNVAFYHTRGTANTDDDYLIMVIGVGQQISKELFDVQVDPDFDPNGDIKAEFSLTANADNSKLFIATTRPDPDGIRGSFQYQWYSITDSGATDSFIGIADTISESLDINGHALPESMAYGVTITYTDRTGNVTTTELTTPAINVGVIGTAATESIKGGLANDPIDGKGGNDHIWGGYDGNDIITLSTEAGDIETIYYRMTSSATAIKATDGHDTINNFRIGEDRLILIDRDSTPLSLDDFMSADMVGVKPIMEFIEDKLIKGLRRDHLILQGVEIHLGGIKAITINFAEGIILRLDTFWQDYARNYVGFAPNHLGPTGEAPLDENGFITDNTLLKNYFGSGEHNNLRIVSEIPDRFEEPSVRFIVQSQTTSIAENIASANLATITATGTGTISYRIIDGNSANHFAIDARTGIITLTKALDYETTPTHELAIAAIDAGHGDTTTNHNIAILIVNVGNVNDNAPMFEFDDGSDEYSAVEVSEIAEAGAMVKQISATDPDGDKLTYRITNFQTQNFDIDKDSGIITVKEGHNLDYDSQSTRQRIHVEVSDGKHTTQTTVPITLINANDEPPEFEGTVDGFETATLTAGSGATGGTSTGYKIGISDPDHQGFNNHEIQIQDGETRFEFRSKTSGILGRQDFELYLKAGESVEAGTITLKYRIYDGKNYAEGDPQSVTVTITSASPPTPAPAPAPAPDYDDYDPLIELTPIPEPDPHML